MAKYLIRATFAAEGARGLMKEGGTSRRETIAKLVAGQGGSLEAFYFAFGSDDVIAIADLPDNVTAAAIGLTISGSGPVHMNTTVLLTPEEVDAATKKTVAYRPPGA